jgi:hypothetical protein
VIVANRRINYILLNACVIAGLFTRQIYILRIICINLAIFERRLGFEFFIIIQTPLATTLILTQRVTISIKGLFTSLHFASHDNGGKIINSAGTNGHEKTTTRGIGHKTAHSNKGFKENPIANSNLGTTCTRGRPKTFGQRWGHTVAYQGTTHSATRHGAKVPTTIRTATRTFASSD